MQIKVEEVHGSKIKFSCAYGEGMGVVANVEPEEGMVKHVEANVLPVFYVSSESKQFVRIEGDETIFGVQVESIDEEDVWLRLSNDFVLVVEEIHGNVSIGDVLHVKLKADQLEIYIIGS